MANVKNLNSNSVKVFPVAKERGSTIPEVTMSRLLTEFNMSNIIRQLIGGSKGFVISASKVSDNKINVEFNLYGYYFDIEYDAEDTGGADADVYASLVYDKTYGELKQDDNGKYGGLEVITAKKGETITGEHTIRLFSYRATKKGDAVIISDDSIVVNPKDRFIFATESLPIGGIDGRHKQD